MLDPLDDLCAICGKPIEDGQPWTIDAGEIVHEWCAEDLRE